MNELGNLSINPNHGNVEFAIMNSCKEYADHQSGTHLLSSLAKPVHGWVYYGCNQVKKVRSGGISSPSRQCPGGQTAEAAARYARLMQVNHAAIHKKATLLRKSTGRTDCPYRQSYREDG